MATGYYDANGIWQYGEDDNIALFSGLLNLGMDSTSDAFTADRARIAFLEQSVEQASTFVASSAAARNSYWGIPANATEQLALQNKGARTVRTDLGITEQYFGLYNASTNPGGRNVAGWYPTNRTVGFIPQRPSGIVVGSGSGAVNALGGVSFSGVSHININGIFSTDYNSFKIVFHWLNTSVPGQPLQMRLRAAGTDSNTTYYRNGMIQNGANNLVSNYQQNGSQWNLTGLVYNSAGVMDLQRVNVNTATMGQTQFAGYTNNYEYTTSSLQHEGNVAYDGFTLFNGTGVLTGYLSVYGYNY